MAAKRQEIKTTRATTKDIYVNYPNDSPLIIQAAEEEGSRTVFYGFALALQKGEDAISGLKRVCLDIVEKLR